MFKDRDEALEEMTQALLEEENGEDVFEDYDDLDEDFYDAEEDPDIYNADSCEEDLEDYSGDLLGSPKKDNLAGLALTCIGLMLGILGLVAYWLLRFWV